MTIDIERRNFVQGAGLLAGAAAITALGASSANAQNATSPSSASQTDDV